MIEDGTLPTLRRFFWCFCFSLAAREGEHRAIM